MRKWIIILAGIIIAVVIGYTYIYQDHRSIEAEKAEFTISSEEIAQLFSENSISAEHKFLNKTIVVSGIISEINAKDITISEQVL